MKKYKMTLMFDDLDKAMGTFCFSRPCGTCPLMRGNNGSDDECSRLRVENPGKAAELMGLEVVEVEDKPRLTEAELAICKAVGAKWVSINDDGGNVDLWDEEPCKGSSDYFIGYPPSPFGLARIASGLFPSLNPGDCVKIGKETAKNELLQTAQKISVIISSLSFVWRKNIFLSAAL